MNSWRHFRSSCPQIHQRSWRCSASRTAEPQIAASS